MNLRCPSRLVLLSLELLFLALSPSQAQVTGELSFVRAFSPSNGVYTNPDGIGPHGGLVEGPDGNFYGTTELSGVKSGGTLFMVTPAGYLSGDFSQTVIINYKVAGANVPGVDIKNLSGKVTIRAGAASAKLNVSALADGVADGDKLITIKLKGAKDGSYRLGKPSTAKILVHDLQSQ